MYLTKAYTYQDLYTLKSSDLTLEEALEIHYQLNPGLTRWHEYSNQSVQKTMRAHDRVHVLFGCDTSFLGELRAEAWTLFGTSTSWAEYLEYASAPEVLADLQKIGYWNIAKHFLPNLSELIKVFFTSKKMNKPYPIFSDLELNSQKLAEIRKAYGIEILN